MRAAEAVGKTSFASLYEMFAATDSKSNVSPAPGAPAAYDGLRQQLTERLVALGA